MAIKPLEAIDIISKLDITLKFEILPIEDCIDRICAENIFATSSLPKFNNSAMDGYAIIYGYQNIELEIIDTIFAGDDNKTLLDEKSCIKIMTGARIPSNATAIIPKEDTIKTDDNKIKIIKEVQDFQHIRFIGEDIKKDDLLIKKGEVINFSKITLLASQGISHIKIYKKPKIVVFASGEELKLHYEKIESHQIYNSNTPTFLARTKELGCDVTFIGQAKDSIEAIKGLVKNSLNADLIITSGGVSVGDADFTKEAFKQLNCETIFEGIQIKPGKPTVLGKIDNTYILNLPGNPLASALIFELFGRVLIQKLIGAKDIQHGYILSKLNSDFKTKKGKITILPGIFDGEYFSISQKRSPGMVSTLGNCNSMIVINDTIESIKKESIIKIIPINWKFFKEDYKDFLINE